MALRKTISIILLFLLVCGLAYGAVYVVNGRDVNNRGGTWIVPRKTAFTTTMGVSSMDAYSKKNLGANLLSLNYYTLVVVDSSSGVGGRDSIYTLGLDSLGLFPDSAVSGTGWSGVDTTCLYLDGFVSETLEVAMFVSETAACTLFVTVEQSMRFDTTLADSGFNYGFFITDTLFKSRMTADYDSLYVGSVSLKGSQSRIYTDRFRLDYPCLRLKIFHLSDSTKAVTPALLFELSARHNNTIMSGTSGRLQEQIR